MISGKPITQRLMLQSSENAELKDEKYIKLIIDMKKKEYKTFSYHPSFAYTVDDDEIKGLELD